MFAPYLPSLLWFCSIGFGIMTGVYFAFSAFVMTSLGKLAPQVGIAAMQAINRDIQRSAFMPLFFATTLGALGMIIAGALAEQGGFMMISGAIYVAGMFLSTVLFNVPLNNRLDAQDPESPAGEEFWHFYCRRWTFWNHSRTLISGIAMALSIKSLTMLG